MKLKINQEQMANLVMDLKRKGENLNDYFEIEAVEETTLVEGQKTLTEFTEPEEKTAQEILQEILEEPKKNKPRKKTTKRKGTGKKRGRPKGSKNKRQSKTRYSLKGWETKARARKPPYGWDREDDGKLVPNWEEQSNIDWMKAQLKAGQSAMGVAEILNMKGIKGKSGGNWYSSGVLEHARNRDHAGREKFPKPKWFDNRDLKKLL